MSKQMQNQYRQSHQYEDSSIFICFYTSLENPVLGKHEKQILKQGTRQATKIIVKLSQPPDSAPWRRHECHHFP